MIIIKREQEGFESLIGRFNRWFVTSGILKDLKRHEYFEKPSTVRRRKKMEALARYKRKEKENALYQESGQKPIG